MSSVQNLKTTTIALGAAIATSLTVTGVVNAEQNPFKMQELSSGYLLAAKGEEGKCGEGKCGEGKCGSPGIGTHVHTDADKIREGKCGEGKCGEGKCGSADIGEHRHVRK